MTFKHLPSLILSNFTPTGQTNFRQQSDVLKMVGLQSLRLCTKINDVNFLSDLLSRELDSSRWHHLQIINYFWIGTTQLMFFIKVMRVKSSYFGDSKDQNFSHTFLWRLMRPQSKAKHLRTKVAIHKSCSEVSLVDQDTIEFKNIFFFWLWKREKTNLKSCL